MKKHLDLLCKGLLKLNLSNYVKKISAINSDIASSISNFKLLTEKDVYSLTDEESYSLEGSIKDINLLDSELNGLYDILSSPSTIRFFNMAPEYFPLFKYKYQFHIIDESLSNESTIKLSESIVQKHSDDYFKDFISVLINYEHIQSLYKIYPNVFFSSFYKCLNTYNEYLPRFISLLNIFSDVEQLQIATKIIKTSPSIYFSQHLDKVFENRQLENGRDLNLYAAEQLIQSKTFYDSFKLLENSYPFLIKQAKEKFLALAMLDSSDLGLFIRKIVSNIDWATATEIEIINSLSKTLDKESTYDLFFKYNLDKINKEAGSRLAKYLLENNMKDFFKFKLQDSNFDIFKNYAIDLLSKLKSLKQEHSKFFRENFPKTGISDFLNQYENFNDWLDKTNKSLRDEASDFIYYIKTRNSPSDNSIDKELSELKKILN